MGHDGLEVVLVLIERHVLLVPGLRERCIVSAEEDDLRRSVIDGGGHVGSKYQQSDAGKIWRGDDVSEHFDRLACVVATAESVIIPVGVGVDSERNGYATGHT